jgi:hypothetical protein
MWEQLVNALQRGENVPGNKVVQTKYTNPGNKRNPWSKEGLEQYNVLHEEVHQDRLSIDSKHLGCCHRKTIGECGNNL